MLARPATSIRSTLWVVLLALWLMPGAATAHPIYVAQVKETITDDLTKSPVIVLARPTADDPFRFHPQIWLKGSRDDDLPPIKHLVDSETRYQLAKNTTDAVLFVYRPDEGEDPGWKRLAYANTSVRQLVDTILAEGAGWDGGRDDPARFAYFAERHNDPDPTIRSLALLEILQSRYGLMRTLEPRLTRAQIQLALRDPMQVNMAPLYVAMLGLMGDADASTLVREMVEQAHRLDLGAEMIPWATALIEVDGARGVDRLAEVVTGPARANHETARAALTALGLHGSEGRVELRQDIAEVLAHAATLHPSIAVYAISPLASWQDWRAKAAVEAHLTGSSPVGLRERMALTGYLAAAAQDAASQGTAVEPKD